MKFADTNAREYKLMHNSNETYSLVVVSVVSTRV